MESARLVRSTIRSQEDALPQQRRASSSIEVAFDPQTGIVRVDFKFVAHLVANSAVGHLLEGGHGGCIPHNEDQILHNALHDVVEVISDLPAIRAIVFANACLSGILLTPSSLSLSSSFGRP